MGPSGAGGLEPSEDLETQTWAEVPAQSEDTQLEEAKLRTRVKSRSADAFTDSTAASLDTGDITACTIEQSTIESWEESTPSDESTVDHRLSG